MNTHTQEDLFASCLTTVKLDPTEESLIKKAKKEFNYDHTISKLNCMHCVHAKRIRLKQFHCALFGFRVSKEKMCDKFRMIG
jgi:hypothetical protein